MLSPIRKSQTTKLSALGVVILLQLCCAAVGSVVHGRQPTQGRVPPPPSLSFTKSLPVISKRFAVIVGVEVYGKDGLPPLTGASASANALADTLVKSADFPRKNVFLFAGSHANSKAPTKENIIRALKQLRGRVGKDGLIVFAFAGYTAQLSIGGYLLTAGAGSTFESAAGSAIRIWDLRDHLKATGAGQLMLLLDGVDADIKDDGSIVSGAAPSDPLDLRDEGFGAFMSLIKESERGSSWPRQRYLMSVFAEALHGRAADERTGRVTMEGALTYVARQTSASATSGG